MAYLDLEEVIDPTSSEHFACEEHLIQYVTEERLEWGEPWWMVNHVSVKYLFSKLSCNLIFFNHFTLLVITS